MVQTKLITKLFTDPKRGEIRAVDGVDFQAVPGQIHGLLGVNGAGKTTLLRMLSTVIKPTSGSGEVAGYDLVKDGEKIRANIGFLSTSTALYGRLTAKEMLEYFAGLYAFEGKEAKERVQSAIALTDVTPFQDQLCDKLSTGQKQRVSIARAILHDPPVLFFDEPTAGLDILTSQTVMGFIEVARDQGKTVILSTHIMSEVERLCDHVTVIHDGKICGTGTIDQLKTQTAQPTLEKTFLNLVQPVGATS